jgi:acyl-CoA synthetase (AMP-forming)/AMP-acid ligase II
MSEGELYVVGRADDVLVIAGKKLSPVLLEETARRHEAVRPGNCAAISDGSGGYLIVAERRRASAGVDMPDACRWIRRELSVRGGVAPSAVIIREHGGGAGGVCAVPGSHGNTGRGELNLAGAEHPLEELTEPLELVG